MATANTLNRRVFAWVTGLVPLAVIALMVAVFLITNPIASLRPVPPVESLSFERTVFRQGEIELHVRNEGPDPVTIAQVLVNDGYWDFTTSERTLSRLESSTVTVRYPWEDGLPVNIAILTSTGVTIEHEVEAATLTPEPDATTFLVYSLLGVYIGVVPVAIGLLWFPALRSVSRRWLSFFLAFTVGLLVFLLVDTIEEGLEISGQVPAALNGIGLFAIGALGAVLGLIALGARLERSGRTEGHRSGLVLAYLVAAGIGLHNLGEGLAVGAALAAGEVALGTFLVLGFAIHNTTEGLAIVAPLGGPDAERPSLWHFVGLGALAGAPTIAGAWVGGWAFSATWGALAFGVAAGAIAQVVWQIGRGPALRKNMSSAPVALGLALGLLFMYVTGLFTA